MGAIGGLILGLMVGAGMIVTGAGILWLFVFGDNPWPEAAEMLLVAVALVATVVTTIVGMRVGLAWGREPHGAAPSRSEPLS